MPDQFRDLLIEVASKYAGVERLLGEIQSSVKDQARELGAIRERLATLERDEEWSGRERRKVDGRLETGDHTFLRLEERIKTADTIARWCREQLQKKPKETAISPRKKFLWKLLEHASPMIVGFVFWMLYHVLLVGPKIAEAMKSSHGGSH